MSDKLEKQIICIGEILWDVYKGIYKQTIWYSDGSIEERFVSKGPIILKKDIQGIL